MKNIATVIILLGILLTACTPSETSMQTAIAQTQVNQATATTVASVTPVPPTSTPEPTATSTPEPTATSTPEPTPTPDLRVIDIELFELLLKTTDCNPDGKYYYSFPGVGSLIPHTSTEGISDLMAEKGGDYLAEVGRIKGQLAYYARGNPNVLLPKDVGDIVIVLSSIESARLVVTEFDDLILEEYIFDEIFDVPQVGDISRVFIFKETDNSGGTRIWYDLAFSYRNVVHQVSVYGYENEVKVDDAVYLAQKLLDQLENLPLSDEVTIKP